MQLTQASRRRTSLATLTANWRPRLLGAVIAMLACVLIWLAGGVAGASFVVSFGAEEPPMEVTLGAVIGSVLAAAVAGWVLRIALELLTTRARTIWTAVALTAAAVSLLPAFAYEADVETTVSLTFMHIAAAAAIIPFFRRRGSFAAGKTHTEH
ncbi:MAG TPA: DUF6069 family protein [Longimicrobiales bacterium]|nr:DUF6069 family protein [Longimicrobiales bacterium]